MTAIEIANEKSNKDGQRFQLVLESTGTGDYCIVDTKSDEVVGKNLLLNTATSICDKLNKLATLI